MLRRFGVILLFLLCLMGCAGPRPLSSSVGTSTGPGLPITAAASALPSTAGQTPTPTAPQETTPGATRPIVRIRNVATGTYLYEQDGQAQVGDLPASNPSSLWVVEDYQGSLRLQNRASSNYLSIEHLEEYVEIIPIFPEWMSPRWTFEGDVGQGAIVIRNVWHNWQLLYVEAGQVRCDRIPVPTDNARWLIEAVSGLPLANSTAAPVPAIPPPTNPPTSRGAAVPWVEYEAEQGQTNGEVLAPDRTFGTIASESSGRSAVRLDARGEYVRFRAIQPANAIVVRFVIPDSDDGQGLDATLSLYVEGVFRQTIQLTSRYAWSYGGEEWTLNAPQAGGAHHFYDEARALVGDIPAGALVSLQIDAGDDAEYYVLDLVDLEQVAPPGTMPEGYLSIVEDCGAVPNDGEEDGDAIRSCIARAEASRTGVWIPAGTFESNLRGFEVQDVTLQGAGMWYSIIHGSFARFLCTGNNCRYFDFAILGETVLRQDNNPDNGFNGGAGTGSRLENIWVEHTKVGYWVGGGTNGLIITGSRFRNLFADGVNFCNGTSYSLVENSHFRNTGDDALASWSPLGDRPNTGNVFRFNTVQVPWRANCFAIYGGTDNRVANNLCFDVVTYPGILIAQQFNANPFDGVTVLQSNALIRAGGPMFHDEHGALKIWAAQGEISGLLVSDLLIDSPTFSGIELEGSYPITHASFDHIEVRQPGTWGILFHSNTAGEVAFSFVVVSNPGAGGLLNYAPSLYFTLDPGEGNRGWEIP
ncbi:MAG: hypothetical protein JXB85_16280 [Anaerolineales bacterium]|nr:hypothetical protein [Anaerolineales bacterium]